MAADITSLTLTEVAARIRTREASASEVLDAVLARAKAVQPKLNCFLRIDEELARAAAKLADADLARGHLRGPLHGVPLAHKDMYYRAGVPSSCGSRIKGREPEKTTATALKRLDAAGAIQFGVLHMAEFAYGPTGHNYHDGHCRNPWNTAHVTGGSSSGSGSSVAARAGFAALGSDTGGSVRLPAAICGITGLKVTYGRVSRAGAMPLSHSMDTVGPLARSAQDCAAAPRRARGRRPRRSRPRRPSRCPTTWRALAAAGEGHAGRHPDELLHRRHGPERRCGADREPQGARVARLRDRAGHAARRDDGVRRRGDARHRRGGARPTTATGCARGRRTTRRRYARGSSAASRCRRRATSMRCACAATRSRSSPGRCSRRSTYCMRRASRSRHRPSPRPTWAARPAWTARSR